MIAAQFLPGTAKHTRPVSVCHCIHGGARGLFDRGQLLNMKSSGTQDEGAQRDEYLTVQYLRTAVAKGGPLPVVMPLFEWLARRDIFLFPHPTPPPRFVRRPRPCPTPPPPPYLTLR